MEKRKVGRPEGTKLSEATKQKIAKSKTGFEHSEETKQKISISVAKYMKTVTSNEIGDKRVSGDYIQIYTKKGWRLEHRVIAGAALGRELKRGEVVHHINRDKTNNKNNNLLVCSSGYHRMLHHKMSNWSRYSQGLFRCYSCGRIYSLDMGYSKDNVCKKCVNTQQWIRRYTKKGE